MTAREFLAGRPSRPRRVDRARMIAPARVARLRRAARGRQRARRSAAALARVRTGLPDERDRALAGEIATGTLRWQAAFDRIVGDVSRTAARRGSIREVLDILRLTHLPAAASRSRPGVGRRQRCRQPRQARRQEQRRRVRQRVLRRVSRERRPACRCRRAPGDAGDSDAVRTTSRSRCRIRRGSCDRWLAALRVRGRGSVGAVRQRAGRR